MGVKVYITKVLKTTLESQSVDVTAFQFAFANWRHNWPQNEYTNEFFGKDVPYQTPLVDGQKNILRHVHITPIAELEERRKWYYFFRLRKKKTSDRHLVYVNGGPLGYLLIDILEEPYAHKIALMETREDAQVMRTFAKIAEEFLIDGTIIA